jgi:hypothetical protein
MSSPTYKVGEQRRNRGTLWTVIKEMPHLNGDPAHLRCRSEKGVERTFYAVDWSQFKPVVTE